MNKVNCKIAIVGAYGENNFGDDALLKTIYNNLIESGYSKESLIICTLKPNYFSYLEEMFENSKIMWFGELVNKDLDFVVYGGGTQIFSFKKTSTFLYRLKAI